MKDTVTIVFNGGSYGTYLEWCLTTLCKGSNPESPFTKVGNSHNFKGVHLIDIEGWRKYVNSTEQHKFVRLHPKIKNTDSIAEHINEISMNTSKIIYLYPDRERILLGINNFFYKVRGNWVEHSFNNVIDPNIIYKNWPVSKDVALNKVPRWIMREFLSFYLMPAWFDQTELHAEQSFPRTLKVSVSDLLFNFEDTLLTIGKEFGLEYQLPISTLLPWHKQNLELQQNLAQDQICKSIIESINAGTDISWPTLPLPSEAWVQWELRNQGFEIRCDGLDIFPTNSIHLKELLYSV